MHRYNLDRRCLMSILKKYYVADILDDGFKFTPSGTYYAPAEVGLCTLESSLPVAHNL